MSVINSLNKKRKMDHPINELATALLEVRPALPWVVEDYGKMICFGLPRPGRISWHYF